MAAILVDCSGFVFGIPTQEQMDAPVVGLPLNAIKTRFRFRNNAFPQLFVRTTTGIRRFSPKFENGQWRVDPEFEQGGNKTV